MTKGLLNSKEQINRLCFIDQLINKYYNSTDMTEVLDYISWRSPTICYNSCQGASLGNFKGERKYQFEKIYRQILLLTIPSRNPNVWVFSSVLWPEKCKYFLKRNLLKITEIDSRKWVRMGSIHERKSFSFVTAGQLSWWWKSTLKCFWHPGFGTWPLKLWDSVRRWIPISQQCHTCSVQPSGHQKSPIPMAEPSLTEFGIQQATCASQCQETFGIRSPACCWETLK